MSRVAQMALLGGIAAPATIGYVGLTSVAYNSGGNCSASAVPIGAAASDRRVIMIVHWLKSSQPAPSLSSATIGGVAVTIHAQTIGTASSFGTGTAIISAPLAAGTTANVTLTFSGAATPYLGVYRATGLLSGTAGDTIIASPTFADPYTGAIDVTNQGILLFGGTLYSAATDYATGGVTENYESVISTNTRVLGASLAVTATEPNRAVSITRTGGSGSGLGGPIIAAAFR